MVYKTSLVTFNEVITKMSALCNLKFPESLFSNERVNIEEYRCSDAQLDHEFDTYTYIDGFLAISKEAQLGFIKNPTGNAILEKGELAYWYEKERFKGVRIKLWDGGLPVIKVKFVTDILLTFIPNVESERENYQITLAAAKRLYEAVLELIIPNVIRKMPSNGFTKVMNTSECACESYYIHAREFVAFSESLLEELNQPQPDPRLAALKYCKLHFLMKAFGQNLTLNENSKHFQNLVTADQCIDCLIHIATDIGQPNYTLLWARDFVRLVFGNAGNVYFSCGLHSAANGDGRVLNDSTGSDEIDGYVRLMKLYNSTFKRLPQTVSQAVGVHFSNSFSDPRIAKLLSLQHRGISDYERLKPKRGKIVDALRQRLISRIIMKRLELLSRSNELHKARVELIISLCEEGAWHVIEENFTGQQIPFLIRWLCDFNLGMDITPLYAIPRGLFTEFLTSEITTLLGPIDDITERFFGRNKPATPDQLFTVYLCEIVIDFIIHGTKNFLHALKSLNITGNTFRDMNRVTFFGIEFRRKGHFWLLDASCARPSNVYTIARPEGPQDPEPLTDKLLRVHCSGKLMLNKYSIAMCLLAELMEDIHRVNMRQFRYRRLHGQINVHSVFSRAFLRTRALRTPSTVSQFVEKLESGPENLISRISESVTIAEEVLGDILEYGSHPDAGQAELKDGMTVVLNCSLKGHLPVEVFAVPKWKGPGLMDHENYSPLMPDLTDVLIQNNPPVFEANLLKKLLVCVNVAMGELQPFPRGIHTVQPWHLSIVYKVLLSNVRDATKVAMLVGCAIEKTNTSPVVQRKLTWFMKNYRIRDWHLRRYNLLAKDNGFSYSVKQTVKPVEALCLNVLRKLQSTKASPF